MWELSLEDTSPTTALNTISSTFHHDMTLFFLPPLLMSGAGEDLNGK